MAAPGQHDVVDRGDVDRHRLPVSEPEFLQALEQSAVDQDARAAGLDQVPGAGDRARRAEELQAETIKVVGQAPPSLR